jgi:hypothetical protein
MKISINQVIQIVSAILFAFTLSGLNIDPNATAEQIVTAIYDGNFYKLFTIVVLNLGNIFYHWVKTIRANPSQFWAFWRSSNWWTSVVNLLLSFLVNTKIVTSGIIDPAEISALISFAIAGNWKLLIGGVVTNVVNILIHRFTKNPMKTPQIGQRMTDPELQAEFQWDGTTWVQVVPNTEAKNKKMGGGQ